MNRRGPGPNRRGGPGSNRGGPGPNRGGPGPNRSGPNRGGPRGRGRGVGPGRAGRVARAEQMDDALKEAIRRSLQDVNKDPVEDSKPAASVEQPEATAPAEVELTPPTEEDFKPSAPTETEVKIEEPKDSESFSLDAIGNGIVAEVLGQTLDECAEAIGAMVKEMNRSASDASTESKEEEEEEDSKPAAEVTLTESAEAEPEIAVVAVAEDEPAAEEERSGGATILESVEADGAAADEMSVKSERSEDEWQVVADDGKVDDEILARAAQVIGSALFESDNMSRGDASSLSGGADASFLSSVPTITSESNVPVAVLDQWAAQLIQLRELGFTDDAASVEVLERLQAANIGSESTDEVTVERVVNELLKKKA